MKLVAALIAAVAISALSAGVATATTTPAPVLPNPLLTPGATDPQVTQANIHSTICTRGYTKKVRPSESLTEPEKRASMRQYGLRYPLADFEYDHLIALEIGGAPNDPRNLWPEAYEHSGLIAQGEGSETKDRLEHYLNHQVCSGRTSLATAQREMASNWLAAARQAGLAK